MLAVEAYACEECETVFAGPTRPPRCDDCGARSFRRLAAERAAARYFASESDGR
ncbi:MAG: hypothetical protein ABEJ79_00455 [Halolamina sp.]